MSKTFGIVAALVFIILIAWAIFGGNVEGPNSERSNTSDTEAVSNLANNNLNNQMTENNLVANPNNPVVILKTSLGEIEIELLADKAPKTVDNFLKLARAGFYDGTLFHRVIKNFMIQGGDPLTKTEPEDWSIHGTGGPDYRFDDEINDVKLVRGIVAMANAGKASDGSGTNGSQFFIITAPVVDWLNTLKPGIGWHTPFGRVIKGMEVVTKIESVRVTGDQERPAAHPLEDVVVEKVTVK